MKTVNCNFCGQNDTELVNEGPDLLLGKPGRFRLVRCRHCGLIYQNPMLSFAELSAHYPHNYLPYKKTAALPPSWKRITHNHATRRQCRRVMHHHPQAGRLLDVGCATGLFLQAMRHYGWQVTGVEPNAEAAAYGRDTLGLDIFVGTLAEVTFPAQAFDVVTLWDVLEHVHDPKATLAEISRLLRPGGLLVVSLPNPTSVEARLFGDYWIGWERPRHLYLFTPALIQCYLERAGFTMNGIESFSGRLNLTLLSIAFYCQAKGIPERRWRPWLKIAYNLPLRIATWPLYRLSEKLNKSSVMTVFATRSAPGATESSLVCHE